MRFHFRIPHFATSTVDAGPARAKPVLDGSDVVVPNAWKLQPHEVAMVGRPAVWFSLDIATPKIALGPLQAASRHLRWEQDFGGHLFVAIMAHDANSATLIEAGPRNRNGSGGLVPFGYPENDFAQRGIVDFEPVVIAPPSGLEEPYFAELVRATQRAYDGDQRYVAVEIPFLRVGRDSNSYAVGVLLASGVDIRAIPKVRKAMRYEWTGYPGAEDPVHSANFGVYFGPPSKLSEGVVDVAYHNADGSVRYVVVGGAPHGSARLSDGSNVALDEFGRRVFSREEAHAHGLPSAYTDPPPHIRARRHYPSDPAAAGAFITLVVDGSAVPLEPGMLLRGTIAARHDALGIARLRTQDGRDVVLPLHELGVELRDPGRVDRLFRVGNELTVGLHRDRYPRLIAHGALSLRDRLRSRQLHAPRPVNIATSLAACGALVAALVWWRLRA